MLRLRRKQMAYFQGTSSRDTSLLSHRDQPAHRSGLLPQNQLPMIYPLPRLLSLNRCQSHDSVQEAEIEPAQSEVPTSSAPSQEPIIASSPPATKPAPAMAAKAPPPVAEKPSSFKDRIAAFNKTAAPPIAPFKPGGQGNTTGFVKKPFVAPPPSKNSYIPPP